MTDLAGQPDWSGHSLVHPTCLEGGLGIKASMKLLAKSLMLRFRARQQKGHRLEEA